MNSIENSISERQSSQPILYKQRWLILITLSWLNFTNGILWISYSSISDVVRDFYNVTLDEVNYLSLAFPGITIITGLPVIWGMEILGLRITCVLCGWLNLSSAVLRFVSSDKSINYQYRYPIAMVGQILGAVAQPLAMFSPARLASLWFPSYQRAIATTISAIGNPLGILVGTLIPPFIVQNKDDVDLYNISIGIVVISVISALLPTLAINRSKPRFSPAGPIDPLFHLYSFREQLKLCFINFPLVLLCLVFGIGLGLFTALSTLLEQIFCPYGYPDKFAGTCGGLLIGFGIIGSFFSGIIADKTKKFTEIVQFCLVNTSIGMIAFSILATYSGIEYYIAVSVCYIGTFGVAMYSIALELAAEISYPVSEIVSSGLMVLSGQIFSVVLIILSQFLKMPLSNSDIDITCSTKNGKWDQNFWPFNVFMGSLAVAGTSAMLLVFRGIYKRQIMEKANDSNFVPNVDVSITQ